MRTVLVRICRDADATHRESLRAYGHTFCGQAPEGAICVSSAFLGLPPGHQAGVLAHEVGHLLAGPRAGEEAADRALEAETGIRVQYRDGRHGRCLQWLSSPDRERLASLFEFDFRGTPRMIDEPDGDDVRFLAEADGRRVELATLREAEELAAVFPRVDVWAQEGRRRLAWRPMARNPESPLAMICAWCGAHMSGPLVQPGVRPSHGICESCLQREFAADELAAKNPDDERRSVERDASTGDETAAARLVARRLRAGELTEAQVRTAAALGHRPSMIAMGVDPQDLRRDWSWLTRVMLGPDCVAVIVAYLAAESVVDIVELPTRATLVVPALESVRRWISGEPVDLAALAEASDVIRDSAELGRRAGGFSHFDATLAAWRAVEAVLDRRIPARGRHAVNEESRSARARLGLQNAESAASMAREDGLSQGRDVRAIVRNGLLEWATTPGADRSVRANPDDAPLVPADPATSLPAVRVERLPSHEWRPPRVSFDLLLSGRAPLVHAPEGVAERPKVAEALARLLTRQGIADVNRWEDLHAACGTAARLFVVDRAGERWEVEGVRFDRGGETGRLELVHLGPGGRRSVGIHEGYGRMLPVVVYRPRRGGAPEKPKTEAELLRDEIAGLWKDYERCSIRHGQFEAERIKEAIRGLEERLRGLERNPPVMSSMAEKYPKFWAEWKRFEAALPGLMSDPATSGKWIVFHGGAVRYVTDDEEEASAFAHANFDWDAGFVISRAAEPEPLYMRPWD